MGALDIFCIVVIVIIGIVIFAVIVSNVSDAKSKKNNEIQQLKREISNDQDRFQSILVKFFDRLPQNGSSYQKTYDDLQKIIDDSENYKHKITYLSRREGEGISFSRLETVATGFDRFCKKVACISDSKMLKISEYGQINKEYFEKINKLGRNEISVIIDDCNRTLDSKNWEKIFRINVEQILDCVWFYATRKPYSASDFKSAVDTFQRVYKESYIDIRIAEYYAMKQMANEDILKKRVQDMLKGSYSAHELTLIASSFMWMGAYQVEYMVLQHMLDHRMVMSEKLQERLHSLSNGGGNAPTGYDLVSNNEKLYFDVSSLAWREEQYISLFENRAFQDKRLSYSLAVRDEDNDLFISQGVNVPDLPVILSKIKEVFADEYGDSAEAKSVQGIAVSGSGEEALDGILVTSKECRQMGVFVHIARIGKKLDIRFYTLFMPVEDEIPVQRQQAMSIYNKLSPSVSMWESSLKSTVLMAIQQILNAEQPHGEERDLPPQDDTPEF